MAISDKIRDKLLADVLFRCCLCPDHVALTVHKHHILPISEGGPDTEENLVVVCPNCHDAIHLARDAGRRLYTPEQLLDCKRRWVELCWRKDLTMDQRVQEAPAIPEVSPGELAPSGRQLFRQEAEMRQPDFFSAADFRYLTADGHEYRVKGPADWPNSRKHPWLAFAVEVCPSHDPDESATTWFRTSRQLRDDMEPEAGQDDETFHLVWLRALRRYAIEQTVIALESGGAANAEDAITSDRKSVLVERRFRSCDFRERTNGDLVCPLDSEGMSETTLAVCETCAMPDPWERCAHVRHVRTHPVVAAQAGLMRRECSGLCEQGKDPGGLIPYLCRAGERAPECFEPGLVRFDNKLVTRLLPTPRVDARAQAATDSGPQVDVGLSYAGEDKSKVEAVYQALTACGVTVFYAPAEKARLWGKDLYQYFADLYKSRATYCVVFVSAAYAAKAWPTHELKAAQARALHEQREYILPVRLDNTELPGMHDTVMYLRYDVDEIVRCLLEKLGR